MNTYNGFNARNSLASAVFAILFAVTCLTGALGPASNVQADHAMTIVSQA